MDKTSSAPRHFFIPDSWFQSPSIVYIDTEAIRNGTWSGFSVLGMSDSQIADYQQRMSFHINGILVNKNAAGATSTTCQIRGVLMDDVPNYVDEWDLATNQVHPLRFRRIYIEGTDASGIKIVGQTGNE